MTELPNNQFFCPFCGEQISKNAKICRFCSKGVSWDIFIEHIPHQAQLGEVAKKIFEAQSKDFFGTFGATRKALEKKGSPFLKNLRKDDAEKLTGIFDQSKIQTRVELHIKPQAGKNSKPIAAAIAILSLSIGSYAFFLFKKKSSVNETTPFTGRDVVLEEPAELSSSPSQSKTDLPKEAHANIESLLISTATVMMKGRSGSAFFVSNNGHLISNEHVTMDDKEVEIQTYDGKRFKGKVLISDAFYDLSLIQIENKEYPPLKMGDATRMHAGDTVWTIGAPHGLEFSVTRGIVSYVGRNMNGKAYIQADVAINPGNSGGPMINDAGEVIGVNNFIIKETVGLNFAIPSNYLFMGEAPILKDVIATLPNNNTMDKWKSWEGNIARNTTSSRQHESKPAPTDSNVKELSGIAEQIERLKAKLDLAQNKIKVKHEDATKEANALNSQYQNAATISDQEKIGNTLRKKRIELVDLELDEINEVLAYNKGAFELLTRAKRLSGADPTVVQQYSGQLDLISKSIQETETEKVSKENERRALVNQVN